MHLSCGFVVGVARLRKNNTFHERDSRFKSCIECRAAWSWPEDDDDEEEEEEEEEEGQGERR